MVFPGRHLESFPTLSRQVSGGIHPYCAWILEQFNHDTTREESPTSSQAPVIFSTPRPQESIYSAR